MLKAIQDFLAELAGDSGKTHFAEDDQRLAVAALLVHVVAIDGVVTDDERATLRSVLSKRYELSPEDTDALVKTAQRKDEEAVDLYGFTSVLKRSLEEDGRRKVIEMLWDAVYADGHVSEFEDNMVWRIAELLGVASRDRIALKHAAQERREVES